MIHPSIHPFVRPFVRSSVRLQLDVARPSADSDTRGTLSRTPTQSDDDEATLMIMIARRLCATH